MGVRELSGLPTGATFTDRQITSSVAKGVTTGEM